MRHLWQDGETGQMRTKSGQRRTESGQRRTRRGREFRDPGGSTEGAGACQSVGRQRRVVWPVVGLRWRLSADDCRHCVIWSGTCGPMLSPMLSARPPSRCPLRSVPTRVLCARPHVWCGVSTWVWGAKGGI